MRAVLRCDAARSTSDWRRMLWTTRVAGLTLIDRHLRMLRDVGFAHVTIAGEDTDGWGTLPDVSPMTVSFADDDVSAVLELSADTVVDPRLTKELVCHPDFPGTAVCVDDDFPDNHPAEAKSPFTVGVPAPEELVISTDPSHRAIGVRWRGLAAAPLVRVWVGRYYWHRIADDRDAAIATRKVLLGTMKSTDGFYAMMNRRLSLSISRFLLPTPLRPNHVTALDIVSSVGAAVLVATGDYALMVLGSLCFWFGGVILDGIDGELARARFESSEFGHWLDTVGGYTYVLALFVSLPIGLYRMSGEPLWLAGGVVALAGALASMAIFIAFMRRFARQRRAAEFNLAVHRGGMIGGRHPLAALYRRYSFMIKRAVMPHYVVLFTVAGILPFAFLLILVACLVSVPITAYLSRLALAAPEA